MKKITHPIEVLSIYGQVFSQNEQEVMQNAQCIFGGKALLKQIFAHEMHEPKHKIFIPITSPIEKVFELIKSYQEQGKKVLVLADGDALYFGMGASLVRHFGAENLHIHAGISIVQRLCAAVNLPWHDVKHVSLHGRIEQEHWQALAVAVFSGKPVCVLTDERASVSDISKFLISRGARDLKIYVGENLGLNGENVFSLPLTKATKLEPQKQGYCTILIVPTKKHTRLTLGLDAHKIIREKDLMTKSPVRAVALSLLHIQPSHTVWDIGSGSGAVALEACTLAHEGQVIAVEKNAARIKHMEKNRSAMNAIILEIHHGDALEIVNKLPKPQAVFVGGGLSSTHAEKLLKNIYKALDVGGRMVISCVLLGTLHRVEAHFKKHAIPTQIMQINISNGSALANDVRLVPDNPVFLVSVEKT